MRVSDENLDEFMPLYEEEFGERLTRVQANEMAQCVLTLYELLAKKLSDEPMALRDFKPDG